MLQGWTLGDYLAYTELYDAAGARLAA